MTIEEIHRGLLSLPHDERGEYERRVRLTYLCAELADRVCELEARLQRLEAHGVPPELSRAEHEGEVAGDGQIARRLKATPCTECREPIAQGELYAWIGVPVCLGCVHIRKEQGAEAAG